MNQAHMGEFLTVQAAMAGLYLGLNHLLGFEFAVLVALAIITMQVGRP